MWYPAKITTGAQAEPVTLAQVRQQLHLSAGDSSLDTQLTQLIAAARAAVENYCSIRLALRTVEMKCDFTFDLGRIPEAPLKTVTSLSYVDIGGSAQTLDPAAYEVRDEGLSPSIVLRKGQQWPAFSPGSRITVAAVVGYDDVPADIIAAILLMVGKLYAFSRDDLLKRSETVEGVGETQWSGAVEVSAAMDGITRSLLENYRNWPLV